MTCHLHTRPRVGATLPAALNEILDLMGPTLEQARSLVPELPDPFQPAPEGSP